VGGQVGLHGGTETEPARQHQAALRPAEDPGNGAQVFDGGGFLARGGRLPMFSAAISAITVDSQKYCSKPSVPYTRSR
jgi:hypothetical protein